MRMPYQNELYHYGIPGMKWGIRRYQPYSEKPRGSGKGGKEVGDAKQSARQAARAEKKDRRNASRNRRSLSDKELNDRVNRLQKEQQLKDLTDKDLNGGKKKAEELLKKYNEFNKPARKIITSAVVGVGYYYMKKWVASTLGDDVAAEMANPFKKK